MDGLEDEGWWRGRQDDYLAAATTLFIPTSPLNVIDHLARARRDPTHEVDWAAVDDAVLERWFRRIDHWLDCADFDILRLLTLWCGHRDQVPEPVATAIVERLVAFRYWYTDDVELPEGVTDERWYWSENHRLIFHTCEYLAGQELPDVPFGVTGMTGADHRARAAARIAEWFDEKATDGFSEWHSDVYYAKDLAPLVTLISAAESAPLTSGSSASSRRLGDTGRAKSSRSPTI